MKPYYIVGNPMALDKKPMDEITRLALAAQLIASVGESEFLKLFPELLQAEFEASQFAQREVPPLFFSSRKYKKTHDLIKPIICIHLPEDFKLPAQKESVYLGPEGTKKLTYYRVPRADLCDHWENASWVLINKVEEPGVEHTEPQEGKSACITM